MTTTVTAKIQLRRGLAATWTSENPTLLSGEVGYETDTGKQKIGDGTTAWTSLSYQYDPDLAGAYAPIAKGVTNGDSHDHAGGDGAQIAYSGLSGLPTLGTAAATAATDYATAAQGGKADTALQAGATAAEIHAATAKTTPADADELGLVDSAASYVLKMLTWANLKTALSGVFVKSDTTGVTGADQLTNIISLTQAEYDAIGAKSTTTLYVIVG